LQFDGSDWNYLHVLKTSVTFGLTIIVLPEVHGASMSDQDLDAYMKLLDELRKLRPKDEPKRGLPA
jgi:hypothetical protein